MARIAQPCARCHHFKRKKSADDEQIEYCKCTLASCFRSPPPHCLHLRLHMTHLLSPAALARCSRPLLSRAGCHCDGTCGKHKDGCCETIVNGRQHSKCTECETLTRKHPGKQPPSKKQQAAAAAKAAQKAAQKAAAAAKEETANAEAERKASELVEKLLGSPLHRNHTVRTRSHRINVGAQDINVGPSDRTPDSSTPPSTTSSLKSPYSPSLWLI